MNPVLEEIITNGTTRTIDGKVKKVNSQISIKEGELIQNAINEINAEVSAEVGLAFGTSALFICEALNKSKKTKHYVIDPFQNYEESYGGIGLNNLKKAGYENFIEFMDKPSHLALAELISGNVKLDFAFIDGWHTFDHVLIDFFLIDKILRKDGIVILDDTDWPAIRKVVSFILNNRSYKFIGGSPQRSHLKNNKNTNHKLNKFAKNIFGNKRSETGKLYGAMAFKKLSDDERSWNHFIDF